MASPSVAVIGAGPAGLAAAHAALESGLRSVVFERSLSLGGIWAPWSGAAWPTMTTNLSRFTCAFSDHLWDELAPDFPTQARVYSYLASYADKFDVTSRLRLGCLVTGVWHSGGRWIIEWQDSASGEPCVEDFDAAVIASGFFAHPAGRRLPGVRRYRGNSIHSSEYRSPEDYRRRRVVIVGMSFSGAEVAAELASHGIDVTIVACRPVWILPRYVISPSTASRVPLDLVLYRRASQEVDTALNAPEANRRRNQYLQQIGTNSGEIHPDLWIDPTATDPAHVLISDSLPLMVQSGAISIRVGRVAGMNEYGLTLENGVEIRAESVIWCNGYEVALPFLGSRERKLLAYDPADRLQPVVLHQCTFHPALPRMAFVGFYKAPFFAVMELQARWFAAILAGECRAPGRETMMSGLTDEMRIRRASPRPQFSHGDYVRFADSIARELGVLPDLSMSNEHFDWLWNGPVIAAHYRLRGPHSDPVAALQHIAQVMRCIQGEEQDREV